MSGGNAANATPARADNSKVATTALSSVAKGAIAVGVIFIAIAITAGLISLSRRYSIKMTLSSRRDDSDLERRERDRANELKEMAKCISLTKPKKPSTKDRRYELDGGLSRSHGSHSSRASILTHTPPPKDNATHVTCSELSAAGEILEVENTNRRPQIGRSYSELQGDVPDVAEISEQQELRQSTYEDRNRSWLRLDSESIRQFV